MAHKLRVILVLIFAFVLTACQSTANNSKIVAGAFNMTTSLQQKVMDRYAPKDVISNLNIVYSDQPELKLDIYQPKNIAAFTARPTIVWMHGGGWIAGSKEHARGYFKLLADRGYNVVSVQYQFAPEKTYPTQLHQLNQALAFIQKNTDKYNIDAQHLYLAGDSAGANLVSHYAALLTNPGFAEQSDFQPLIQANQLRGLILHCGIYDMHAFVNTAPDEMKLVEWGVYTLVKAYTQDRKDDEAFLRQISPIQHIQSNYPPVFISGGNKDFLTDSQSLPFVEVLKQHQVEVLEAFYPDTKSWLIHEYQFFMGKKESQQTFERTIDFIEKYSKEDSQHL